MSTLQRHAHVETLCGRSAVGALGTRDARVWTDADETHVDMYPVGAKYWSACTAKPAAPAKQRKRH